MLSSYIPFHIQQGIVSHLTSDPSIEQCGLVVEDSNRNIFLFPSENVSNKPKEDFKIDSSTYLEAQATGQIKAIYHSHILDTHSGYLSPKDIQQSKLHKIPYLLYHTVFQCWDYFDPNLTENPFPLEISGDPKTLQYYLNWRWEWNRCDCWSLVRAYYKGMFDIELEDYSRPTLREIYREGWNAFEENLESRGFERYFGKAEKNDLVVMQIEGSNPHHIGVMVDSRNLLHLYDKDNPSKVERLDGFEDCISSVWRYRN